MSVDRIVVLSFTRKAWQEKRARVSNQAKRDVNTRGIASHNSLILSGSGQFESMQLLRNIERAVKHRIGTVSDPHVEFRWLDHPPSDCRTPVFPLLRRNPERDGP